MGFLLQSQAMVKNTECPGEGAKHFLFFLEGGGGHGKEGKLREKHLEILKLKERHCFFLAGLEEICVCVFFFQVISYCLKKHDYWEISKEWTTIPRESLAIPTL